MGVKEYELPDGRKAVFKFDENGVGKITLEAMDLLMGLIKADLVRCEECKYVGTDATCCLVCCRDGMGLKPYHVYHDDFCSYGERGE